jgi:hypothetical protein
MIKRKVRPMMKGTRSVAKFATHPTTPAKSCGAASARNGAKRLALVRSVEAVVPKRFILIW